MLGAIIGDMVGVPYEFNNIKTKDFELFSDETRFSDDSVLTCAVAKALIDSGIDPSDEKNVVKQLKYFGNRYIHAGYGGRFRKWLQSDETEPYNSLGNGSAMRVSPVGWFYDTIEETRKIAAITAEVTHNHPDGIKGAEATAAVIFLARIGDTKEEIKEYVEKEFYKLDRTCDEIRPDYKFDVSCQGTVPVAITAFLEGNNFEDVLRISVSMGGDSDTLACIACAMAEAYYGIPSWMIVKVLNRLPEHLRKIVSDYYNKLDWFHEIAYKRGALNYFDEYEYKKMIAEEAMKDGI